MLLTAENSDCEERQKIIVSRDMNTIIGLYRVRHGHMT